MALLEDGSDKAHAVEPWPARRGGGRALLAVALCLLLVPCAARGAPEASTSDPGKEWRDGPVRYLLTPEEFERYGKLRTEEAREAFVTRFWRRLESNPTAPENGFRERFEGLCALADKRFSTSFLAGWRTDRGRILIVLGEPDSVRRVAGDPLSVTREIWTYNRRPGGRAEPLEIVFYGDRSGQFRLQPRPGAESEAYRDPVDVVRELQRLRAQFRLPTIGFVSREVAQLYDQLLTYQDLAATLWARSGRLQPLPRQPRSANASAVGGGESMTSPIVSDAAYYFQAADGGIVAVLVLEYRAERAMNGASEPQPPVLTEPLAFAWILDTDGRRAGRGLAEGGVRLERRPDLGRGGAMVFTGRAYLEPGAYEARFAVDDRSRKTLAIRNVPLVVPDIPLGELAASTVVPAERFGPVAEGRHSAFAVGSEEVVPKPGASFRHGEPLKIYFQVYGAARDPVSRQPRMDVTFRFERADSRKFKRHRRPAEIHGAAGESMGLTLSVDDWPAGDYRVEIELLDRVSGAQTSTGGHFRIAD